MEASIAVKEYYYYPLFIDEEIEAQRGESICLRFYCQDMYKSMTNSNVELLEVIIAKDVTAVA